MKDTRFLSIYAFIMLFIVISLIVLIPLKLSGTLSVSWLLVLSPLWIPPCFSIILFIIGMVVILVKDKIVDRKKYIVKELWEDRYE